jgi:hypothetical protein
VFSEDHLQGGVERRGAQGLCTDCSTGVIGWARHELAEALQYRACLTRKEVNILSGIVVATNPC